MGEREKRRERKGERETEREREKERRFSLRDRNGFKSLWTFI